VISAPEPLPPDEVGAKRFKECQLGAKERGSRFSNFRATARRKGMEERKAAVLIRGKSGSKRL